MNKMKTEIAGEREKLQEAKKDGNHVMADALKVEIHAQKSEIQYVFL